MSAHHEKRGERTRTEQESILLEGCRCGDEKAWLALYRAYASDVGLFLKGMLQNPTEIDDLVQQVFMELLSSLKRFRGEASLRTWLHRIARNVALQHLRSRSRRQHYVRKYVEDLDARDHRDPERQVLARGQLSVVHRLLSDLDETFREVWILRELQHFTVKECAQILEIREATVRTRHHRARTRLLELLQRLNQKGEESPPRLRLISSEEDAS